MSETTTTRKQCKVPGCERPVDAKGRCGMDYRRWQAAGCPPDDDRPAVAVLGRADWPLFAACADHDPELWFPLSEDPAEDTTAADDVRYALTVCASCPVRSDCLNYALTALPFGIAGGLKSADRATLRKGI